MAYQLTYYTNPDLTQPIESDTYSDAAFATLGAPAFGSVYARHSENHDLDMVGVHGAWQNAQSFTAALQARDEAAGEKRHLANLPKVKLIGKMPMTDEKDPEYAVQVPSDPVGTHRHIRLSAIRAAAAQSDADASHVYSDLLSQIR